VFDVNRRDSFIPRSIDAAEGRIRFKFLNVCEALSLSFNVGLKVRDLLEHISKSVLCF